LTKPVLEEDLMQALEDLSNEAHEPSVLVLADDPNNLSKIASLFGDTSPYQIRQAIGGTQALKALDYKLPDVILLTADFGGNTRPDTATADIDWFTLLETLHANPKRSTIPILILTETDLDQELRSRLAHFSPEMLLKVPIQSAELLACIEHSLQLRAYSNSPSL
jgi:CheY-like chemotaxis protein